ncbi:MAG TPA: FadR/GntR family transcriptional regulator [Burkholderiaceae bacterium]|jgi:GntR family transcriptional repressor for pyruvate dehydrogenase complex|nr:FadR/GntR family transcriptional regulator [Burkholderiaceae bacterium]
MSASATPLPTLRRRSSRTLAQEAVDALTALINAGTLHPGDKLPTESELMQQLGVSRTVVREAMSRLQASGLVETRHGIGTFVAHPPEESFSIPITSVNTAIDAMALLEVRVAVEVEAAALAAQRRSADQLAAIREALDRLITLETRSGSSMDASIQADFAFHHSIALATGNAYFPKYLAHLGKDSIPRSRLLMDEAAHQRYLHKLNQEHRLIYLAIQAQDPLAASEAARNHLLNSKLRLQRALDEQQNKESTWRT